MAGDDACWLRRVCDCGAMTEGPADRCWRCNEPLNHEGEALVQTDGQAVPLATRETADEVFDDLVVGPPN